MKLYTLLPALQILIPLIFDFSGKLIFKNSFFLKESLYQKCFEQFF
ncbi:hypothetical protein C414_000430030 [Campylobacter jejuni subsp. jejuni 414]|nr:hypothetical protein C414_000430030 [Campylobacter jejuni subsp. jejuni 414]